jgi:hypothetical protein
MTEWYSHFDPNEFAQARRVQENLLLRDERKPDPAMGHRMAGEAAAVSVGKVLTMPKQGMTIEQKPA